MIFCAEILACCLIGNRLFYFCGMSKLRQHLFILMTMSMSFSIAQEVPGFEIYVLSLELSADNELFFTAPENISVNPGYDNQPSFSPAGDEIIFTSMRDGKQTDIFSYNIISRQLQQLTNSTTSEYSPMFTKEGKAITVVRVEEDGAQRLWEIPVGKSKGKLVMRDVYDVGYYAPLRDNQFACFVLPEPFTLRIYKKREQRPLVIDRNIGRSIQPVPGSAAFTYLVKTDSIKWTIKEYNYENKQFSQVATIAPGPEDMQFHPGGNVFMARGSALYYFDYFGSRQWYMFADLSAFGIGEIFRIAFSPDGRNMAIVVAEQ